ncbi:sigma-54 dependent transcriptional regulator [Vibrio kyushuensis]|uniref:sigma-54-dependent transcriptional regulator n=1 Tax=Vibrio kyushuensis TaxID=2910249 RepID=UPI003D1151A3
MIKQVVLIDDEVDVVDALSEMLELEGFAVNAFTNAKQGLTFLRPESPAVLLCDVKMPEIDGLSLLSLVHARVPGLPVILMSGHGDIPMAIEAMKIGAFDFLEKPLSPQVLVAKLTKALEKRQFELAQGTSTNRDTETIEEVVIGDSAAMESIRQQILVLAKTGVDTIINGDTGTGKEVVAQALHRFSRRKNKPFVAINCGGMTESIIESELFGHEAGSFTSANKKRIGKIEQANGGTLFLDEIESMPISVQIKLLRVLQERVVERVGGNELIPVDLVIVAASKADLAKLGETGAFRKDLFYRLNLACINLPKLNQRLEDLRPLFKHFVLQACHKYQLEQPEFHPELLGQLSKHDWPGNIRELRNVVDRFALGIVGDGFNLDKGVQSPPGQELDFEMQMDSYERELLTQALLDTQGNINASAEKLCLPRKTLYRKLKKHNIDKHDFRTGTSD